MIHPILAAVRFDDNQDIDGLLKAFVASQLACGRRINGALQSRSAGSGECHCSDMDLRIIGSGEIFRISQPLGNGSTGCRLHPGMLAECSAHIERQIEAGCDLVVLNRFGKGESDGRGFRDLIGIALFSGIPVLTAIRETYVDAWQEFSGDMGIQLPFDLSAVNTWYGNLERADAA